MRSTIFATTRRAPESVRNEQEYITGFLARQGKLRYWPKGGA